jgi:hypothetical protein
MQPLSSSLAAGWGGGPLPKAVVEGFGADPSVSRAFARLPPPHAFSVGRSYPAFLTLPLTVANLIPNLRATALFDSEPSRCAFSCWTIFRFPSRIT